MSIKYVKVEGVCVETKHYLRSRGVAKLFHFQFTSLGSYLINELSRNISINCGCINGKSVQKSSEHATFFYLQKGLIIKLSNCRTC